MNVEEARAIVLGEGFASDDTLEGAMFVMVRIGEEPSRERMARLLTAIMALFDAQVGQMMVDHRLAAALWTLGEQFSSNLELRDPVPGVENAGLRGLRPVVLRTQRQSDCRHILRPQDAWPQASETAVFNAGSASA